MNKSRLGAWIAAIASALVFIFPLALSQLNFSDSLYDSVFKESLGGLPVLKGGRIMPFSSALADSLKAIGGRSSAKITLENFKNKGASENFSGAIEGNADKSKGTKKVSASKWFALSLKNPASMSEEKIFRTDSRELQNLLGVESRYFSFLDAERNYEKIFGVVESGDGGSYAKACVNLIEAMHIYMLCSQCAAFSPDIETSAEDFIKFWHSSVADASREIKMAASENREPDKSKLFAASKILQMLNASRESEMSSSAIMMIPRGKNKALATPLELLLNPRLDEVSLESLRAYAALRQSLCSGDESAVNSALKKAYALLRENSDVDFGRVKIEAIVNVLDPFFTGLLIYALAFFFFLFSKFSKWKRLFFEDASSIFLLCALLVNIFGIAARMYIQMRPPVTNMYSSIIFTGCCAAALGTAFYFRRRLSVYGISSAAVGFLSLAVALNMPHGGDTMGVMRAVLNSNFWLTAHVVVIMIGYCAVFMAGFSSAVRLVSNLFSKRNFGYESSETAQGVFSMLCFSLMFVFAGTMLGGIWADMSWGRFWGWDPKENGALMTLLWISLCMHARIFSLCSDRIFLALCVFGNVIAAWSWFGVNLMGVGLHSYGFSSGGWLWFFMFVASQLLIMSFAFVKYFPKNTLKK